MTKCCKNSKQQRYKADTVIIQFTIKTLQLTCCCVCLTVSLFASLTKEVQTVGQRKHRQRHTKPQVRHTMWSARKTSIEGTTHALHCLCAQMSTDCTFTSGTAITLQHNGLFIEDRGNRQLCSLATIPPVSNNTLVAWESVAVGCCDTTVTWDETGLIWNSTSVYFSATVIALLILLSNLPVKDDIWKDNYPKGISLVSRSLFYYCTQLQQALTHLR